MVTAAVPTRVDSLKAGLSMPDYIWFCRESNRSRDQEITVRLRAMERSLEKIFRDQDFGLKYVTDEYVRGLGSNAVLERALKGYPSHVFRWFRIGQVSVSAFDDMHTPPEKFEDGISALNMNFAAAGIPAPTSAELLTLVRQMRTGYSNKVMGDKPAGELIVSQRQFFSQLIFLAESGDAEDARIKPSSVVVEQGAIYVQGNASGSFSTQVHNTNSNLTPAAVQEIVTALTNIIEAANTSAAKTFAYDKIAELETAKRAAESNEVPAAIAILKRSAGWIAKFASDVGQPIATEVIKRAIGL